MGFDDIEIKTIEKIDIKKGDVLAFYIKEKIPAHAKEMIMEQMKKTLQGIFGADVPILIIDGDVKMQVIRQENDNP